MSNKQSQAPAAPAAPAPAAPAPAAPAPAAPAAPAAAPAAPAPAAPSTPTTKSFIDSLSQKERKAYVIAENFLETSFDLKKSIGFKKWWLTKST